MNDEKTSCRELISREMAERGEWWGDVEHSTFSGDELDAMFDDGFGLAEGCAFTLWTRRRVYFPVKYDGAETVASVPRNPCDEKTEHVGGGG